MYALTCSLLLGLGTTASIVLMNPINYHFPSKIIPKIHHKQIQENNLKKYPIPLSSLNFITTNVIVDIHHFKIKSLARVTHFTKP